MQPDLDQSSPLNPVSRMLAQPGQWYVLHTRSRQEKAVVADLEAVGAGCYLPLTAAVRYHGRRKVKLKTPLFPGYVFMHGERDQAYAADRNRRLAGIIPVHDPEELTHQLEAIAHLQSVGAELRPHPYLDIGREVEVVAGPFKGVRGVIENRPRPDRLILQVAVLGLGSSLEIDAGLLAPIKAADLAVA